MSAHGELPRTPKAFLAFFVGGKPPAPSKNDFTKISGGLQDQDDRIQPTKSFAVGFSNHIYEKVYNKILTLPNLS